MPPKSAGAVIVARRFVGLLDLGENSPAILRVSRACIGHTDDARRARQQARSEPLLELGDRARHGRRRETELAGASGKSLRVDDRDESAHQMEAIHIVSLIVTMNCILRLFQSPEIDAKVAALTVKPDLENRMSRAFSDIAFTPAVRAMQTRMGTRKMYERLDHADDRRDALGPAEVAYIEERDNFYLATVGETGWPYVQYKGGPPGFLKVLDARTLGYADFRGNVQYISDGNLMGDERVSMILMDYANARRLKILGRAKLIDKADDPALIARLENPAYKAKVERAVIITVEAWDWNCPQHITPRFTEAEVRAALEAANR